MTDKQDVVLANLRAELADALKVERRLSRLEATQYVLVALIVAVTLKVYLP
jgi:hypothetical protein